VVNPDVVYTLIIPTISSTTVNTSFIVPIQAVDVYGNNVTDVGPSTTVAINAQPGFVAGTVQPAYCNLVGGSASVSLQISQAGTGFLRFSLSPILVDSNFFTVS
jgi:hypothetical protein